MGTFRIKATFSPLDLLEELSENTGLSYTATYKILKDIKRNEFVKNPPQFINRATSIIKNIE